MYLRIFLAALFSVFLFGGEEIKLHCLQPGKFSAKAGEKLKVDVMSGILFEDKPMMIKKTDLVKAELSSAKANVDLLPSFNEGSAKHFELVLPDATSSLQLRSAPENVTLDAETFNAFIKDYDQEEVIGKREATHANEKSARVLSSWNSVLLMQAGDVFDETYKKSTGYPLEIVPEKNPYAVKSGESLRLKIVWSGKPVFGIRVKVWTRHDNNSGLEHIYTGKDGVIDVPFNHKGSWLISVVKMIPSRNDQADWQNYQSTLTFGF